MKSVQSCRCFHSKPIALLQIHRHLFKTPINLFPGVLTAAALFSFGKKARNTPTDPILQYCDYIIYI